MTRRLALSLVLLVAVLVPVAEAQRQRSVRVSAPTCSFSLSVAFPNPVPDAGMSRGRLIVNGSPSSCTSWNAYSPVPWIIFESGSPSGEAAVTVLANTSTSIRTATVLVAGLDLVITQLGKPEAPIIETGIIKNGAFATDLSFWGWQDRFPNGVGTVTWSNLDANGSAASGSLRMRNTQLSGPGMQILQCVQIPNIGEVYDFKFAYRMQATFSGAMAVRIIEFASQDCTGPYDVTSVRLDQTFFPNNTEAWRREETSFRTGATAQSAIVVFGAKTQNAQPFDAYVDDVVFLKR